MIDVLNIKKTLLRMAGYLPRDQCERRRAPRNFVQNYDDNASVEYEKRAVAFIDILGWKNAVYASETDQNIRRKLLNIVWFFAARANDYVETETADHPSRDEYTQFSDSLIISFPYSAPRDLFRLLTLVKEFQTSMLLNELPIRGGVTVGDAFHVDAIAFGPAVNQAYYLESQIAQMPRVVIDTTLNRIVNACVVGQLKRRPLICCGNDGYYETDFLAEVAMTVKIAKNIEQKIDTWIKKYSGNERVREKYVWLKACWEAAKRNAILRQQSK